MYRRLGQISGGGLVRISKHDMSAVLTSRQEQTPLLCEDCEAFVKHREDEAAGHAVPGS
jgi:hypothetical protein